MTKRTLKNRAVDTQQVSAEREGCCKPNWPGWRARRRRLRMTCIPKSAYVGGFDERARHAVEYRVERRALRRAKAQHENEVDLRILPLDGLFGDEHGNAGMLADESHGMGHGKCPMAVEDISSRSNTLSI